MDNATMINYKQYIQEVIIFVLLLEIAYLIGYWSTFDINIFPYLTLSDIIKFAAYPLLFIIPVQLLQLIIAELHIYPVMKKYVRLIKPESVKFRKIIELTLFLIIIGVGKWLNFTMLYIGFPLIIIFVLTLKKFDKFNESRYITIFLMLLLLPFLSFDIGKRNATIILKGKEYSYSLIEVGAQKAKFKFLGYINDHYFFISINNRSLIIQRDRDLLILEKYLAKNQDNNETIGFT